MNMKIKCLTCQKRNAVVKKPYGVLPCELCQTRQKQFHASETVEITTPEIKEDRIKFGTDIEQRYEGGTPNLNYINKYGVAGFTSQELQAARARHGTYYRDSWDKYQPARDNK